MRERKHLRDISQIPTKFPGVVRHNNTEKPTTIPYIHYIWLVARPKRGNRNLNATTTARISQDELKGVCVNDKRYLEDQVLEVGEARSPTVNAGRAVFHRRRQDTIAQPAEASVSNAAHVTYVQNHTRGNSSFTAALDLTPPSSPSLLKTLQVRKTALLYIRQYKIPVHEEPVRRQAVLPPFVLFWT